MLHKTRGIVFKSTEYGESSLVVQIYTELFGIQSYLINSVRKKHAKYHANLFQRLTPVDMVVYHKERPGLQRISEIKPNPLLESIPFDVHKSSLIIFLDEVLFKSIREEEANPQLFDFLMQSIQWLDHSAHPGNNFHLTFLVLLSRYLGFGPTKNYSATDNIFNLKDGCFQSAFPDHPHFIQPELGEVFFSILNSNYTTSPEISTPDRRTIINFLLEYYALHIESFGTVKSHKVLEEIFNES
jgi:DNA repair protein RecO (recombination protein O)